MIFEQTIKYYLANYLVDRLDAGKKYTKEEIEGFIAASIDPSTYDEPTMTLDHLRMAMLDNRFLTRDPAGRQYWVAETFIKVSGAEEDSIRRMQLTHTPAGKTQVYRCRQCSKPFKDILPLTRHHIRNHTYSRNMDKISRYLLEEPAE
jgi:hypothetical protein